MKVYLVNTIDERNNATLIGFYKNLKNATKDIKEAYNDFDGIEDLELVEYASTFGYCFDTELSNDDTGEFIRVFGYILDKNALIEEVKKL